MLDPESVRRQEQAEMERNVRQLASEEYREVEEARRFLIAHADAAQPLLLECVRQGRPGAQHAAYALAAIGRPESVAVLIQAAQRGNPHAVTALGRHAAPAALEALLDLLGSGNSEILAEACRSLVNRGDAKACDAVKPRLGDPDDDRRYHITLTAAQLKCLNPQELASMLAKERDRHVRRVIKNALGLPLSPEEAE